MKKKLFLLTILVSLNAYSFEGKNICKENIFKGLSKDHLKQIAVCKTKDGFISYTEGTISDKDPDVDILIPVADTTWDNIFKDDISIYALNFFHEKNKYSLILGYERDGDGAVSGVYVTEKDKGLAVRELQLDPETVEENITPSLTDYGIDQYTK